MSEYVIEMCNITKEFPGIIANDNITLQLKKGEIHALLGENGAGKSTLMSVLFGLYQPEKGVIKKDGKEVKIKDPNDANALGIGKQVLMIPFIANILLPGLETYLVGQADPLVMYGLAFLFYLIVLVIGGKFVMNRGHQYRW